MIGIYKISSITKPERFYIGSSVNIRKRWREHLWLLKINDHHSKKLQRHFDKYGESDLLFSILLSCEKEDLLKIEQYFLDSYNPYFNGSKTAGSCLGFKHSDESKQKMRERRLGHKHSEESKQKMRESKMGNIPWNKGKKMPAISQETRQKMSKIRKGMVSNFKGKRHTEESLRKMQDTHKGPRPWMIGTKKAPHTEDAKRKMRLAWSKRSHTFSEETRLKMKNRTPWNKGKTKNTQLKQAS